MPTGILAYSPLDMQMAQSCEWLSAVLHRWTLTRASLLLRQLIRLVCPWCAFCE